MGHFKLKKGYDLPLAGVPDTQIQDAAPPQQVAVLPIDFRGLRPALKVQVGDRVKRGTVLFVDKKHPAIQFLSPAAGTVSNIVRGERRTLLRVVVDVEGDEAESFPAWTPAQIKGMTRDDATRVLMEMGLWPTLRKRPYTRIADPETTPKAIFISAVDSAPLAAASTVLLESRQADFQAGVEVLRHLTDGKIHISTRPDNAEWFRGIQGVDQHVFEGPHPSGNISVQVFHIDRLKHGETIWFLSPRHVAQIGRCLQAGAYLAEKIVARTGSAVTRTCHVRTREGARLDSILQQSLDDKEMRVISGDVLTGRRASSEGFLSYYDDQITVIPEVSGKRFLGWVTPGFRAPSFWRAFVSTWLPGQPRVMNTDKNGEDRAFVATGEYEKVMPMDILPSHLAKAVLVEDIELMEQLGIYEVAPEDFALCSYICPSKIEFGEIFEHGQQLMEKEG